MRAVFRSPDTAVLVRLVYIVAVSPHVNHRSVGAAMVQLDVMMPMCFNERYGAEQRDPGRHPRYTFSGHVALTRRNP